MIYLLGSILLTGAGFFISASLYGEANINSTYIFGTIAYIAYMVGFLLLEYAIHYFPFSIVFNGWSVGLAFTLSIASFIFWGESLSGINWVSLILITIGIIGLLTFEKNSNTLRR